jgi:hypothetical protein
MSKYTTEVRNICETYAGRTERGEYTDVDTCIDLSIPKIFDVDNIPVYVPEHKPLLFHKILLHYYQREIGFETVGLWKLKLNTKLKEIMPYYNQLYASELLEYDPLQNVNNWHEHQGVYEDTSKVDNKKKYDNTTTTDNTEVAENDKKYDNTTTTDNSEVSENTRKHDNVTTTDNSQVSESTSKYDNTTDNTNNKVSNSNVGTITSDENTNVGNYNGTETTLLKNQKKTTRGQDTDGHNVTRGRDQWTLYSDTPQGGIGGLQNEPLSGGSVELDGNNYLTNATHVIDNGGQYQDTKTYGDITESYNVNNNTPDTVNRGGSESSVDSRNISVTQNENENDVQTGKQVDNALTHDAGTKVEDGKKVDDALTHDAGSKVEDGKKVDDALTHFAGSKVEDGKRVDDALTVDDNLKKDNGSDAHTNREYGKIGVMTYQEMVIKYRETFLNIDMMIIDELKDLFMKVW